MITSIVFFFTLALSVILLIRIVNEIIQGITPENEQDWYFTPIGVIIVSFLWSWLFWLLH